MSADIVNLKRARKRKTRADGAAKGAENRVLFGQSRAARDAVNRLRDRRERSLDGHRLSKGDDDVS